MMKNLKRKILAYALKNAIEHEGKTRTDSVLNSLFHEGLEKKDIKKVLPDIQKAIKEINSLQSEEQKKKFKALEKEISHRKEREGLPDLPNVKDKVITRMSPSPSGPLHVGHILTILPNFLYTQKYGGTFYIRIEDTNPENIYKPAYKMIEQEARWLCKGKVKTVIQSERISLYYKYIKKLVDKGAVYVCTCKPEIFKQLLLEKKPCPCRNLSKKEQLERWKEMLNRRGYKEGEAVVRFKSNLQDKNPALRDFPLARINLTEHPIQKNKYRVWPLMNLAVTVDDIEMKMTHIIRGKEHRDNAKKQKMIYKALGKEKKFPWTAFIGRLHFKDMAVSASKMRQGIESGEYKGWDDPRLPTAASLKKRYKPESFWEFSKQMGISEVDKVMDKKEFFKLLDQFNK
jgi:glutamyl-tRNA synthetase